MSFAADLSRLIGRYRSEFNLSLAEAISTIEAVKLDTLNKLKMMTENKADCPTSNRTVYFVCPDGDLLSIRPLSSIWLDARKKWWKSQWIVRLEYADGEEYCWERDSEKDAKFVRDRLIEIFSNAQPTIEITTEK